MSANRDAEPEEANLSYPSPGAEGMDTGPFYNTTGRDGTQEHQEHQEHHEHHEQHHEQHHEPHPEHQPHQEHPDHPEQHMPEQVPVQDHEQQPELPPQEPETPQQHVSRPTNLVELQLAAQLGQGLAGTSMMPATDPNMNVEDPNLRSIMPHPEPEQQHTPSYVPEPPTTDPMVQHSMPAPVGPPLPPQYAMPGDNIPPRKRSKVSRACDECRRKKIKCDATSDTGETPCSSCARSSIRCLFSRVPQKRGPSKGYIKELADRIHSIENKLESEGQLSQDDLDRLFNSDRPRAPSNEDSNRKRPFSSISAGEFSSPAGRQTPWGSQHRPIQPSGTATDSYGAPYTANTLAPQPEALKVDSTPSKPPLAAMDITMPDAEELPDVDEGAFHNYLSSVQGVYPILPNNIARVQSLLSQVPVPLRLAFANALPAVGGGTGGDVKLASALLNEWESSETIPTQVTNIVHAQTLIMLIIDADWRSSVTFPFLLGRAVALAHSMKLWRYTPIETVSDPDSDDQLCVRIWWSLVLMDRWHAAGSGKPSTIPDSSVVAPPDLENILGEVCFYLVRLSKFLNRVSHVVSTLQPGTSTTEQSMAGILTDYIENYREDLPAHIEPASYPLVHLAYWHCKVLVSLLTPGAAPGEISWPTKELVNLLSANSHIRSPLVNHFASLVSMALVKLINSESSREEATQLIKDIVDKPAGSVWDTVKDKLTEQIRPTSSVEATASQGLQHLADLATAHEGIAPGADESHEIAFGPSLASGYLDLA